MFILYLFFITISTTIHCTEIAPPQISPFNCLAGILTVKCETTSAPESYYIDFLRLTKVCYVLRFQNCSTSILSALGARFSQWNRMTVDVSNQGWNTLAGDSFSEFVGLRKLIACHNELQTLSDGIFERTHLNYLDLSYNKFEKIESIADAGVTGLDTLLISHNNIVTIDGTTFNNFNHLKILDLSSNNLTHIGDGTFDLLPNLRNLSMAHNNLSSLLNFGIFTHLTFLESLDISNNRLFSIDIGTHSPVFQHLHRMNIESNGITSAWGLYSSTFPLLTYLNLRNNNFECYMLEEILNSFDLKKLRLEMDPSTLVRRGVAVRGVSCRP